MRYARAFGQNEAASAAAKDSGAWAALKAAAGNPVVLGVVTGLINGLIATMRNKPVSIRANLITAVVTGIGEAALLEDQPGNKLAGYGALAAFGALVGLAPFTRWDPYNRAIIEKAEVPAPPLPPELQRAVAAYSTR